VTTEKAYGSLAGRIKTERLITGWVTMSDPLVAAHLAHEDVDAVVVDMQHGHFDVRAAILAIGQILLAGKPAIVRVPVREFATASRMLDAGASGIIAPMISSAADAKMLVEYTKFPPVGERSWGPALALAHNGFAHADYLKVANEKTVVLAMIETKGAIDALDEILSVEGLDGVFVGPTDLSLSLSNGTHVDATREDVDVQINRISETVARHGKIMSGMAIPNSKAGDLLKRGFNLVGVGTDATILRQATRDILAAARAVA